MSARGHERKRSAHLVKDICKTDGKVDGKDDEDDVAFWIAQWPQSIILLLPCRVPECNLNNFSIKLSVCYVVLKNCGYVCLGRRELLPRRSRHGGNLLLEIYCARRRLTGTSFHSRLATTRRNKSGAKTEMVCWTHHPRRRLSSSSYLAFGWPRVQSGRSFCVVTVGY